MPECSTCGRSENLKQFDSSGRYFCSLDEFKKYYEGLNTSSADSNSALKVEQVNSIQAQEKLFCADYWSEDVSQLASKRESLIAHINGLVALCEEYRTRILIEKRHLVKIDEKLLGDLSERERTKPNRPDWLTKAIHLVEKYRKLALSDDKILKLIPDISEFKEIHIKQAIEELNKE